MARKRQPSPQTIAVLEALTDHSSDWSYGYDICRTTDLQAGTVYPILMRLAERGQVETVWETDPPVGRPARHLYRLSVAGAEMVADLARQQQSSPRGARGSSAVEATS